MASSCPAPSSASCQLWCEQLSSAMPSPMMVQIM
ncbi:mCG1047752 [Mus musculus]|nr:mCG1047752 [Mus musculus]